MDPKGLINLNISLAYRVRSDYEDSLYVCIYVFMKSFSSKHAVHIHVAISSGEHARRIEV